MSDVAFAPDDPGMAGMPRPEDVVDPADAQGEPGAAPPVDRNNAERLIRWADPTQTLNIAAEVLADKASFPDGESLLGGLGQKVVREYQIDKGTRSDWEARSKKAMDLAMQVSAAKTTPWTGASNVVYPLISSAAIQFAARAYPAIVNGEDVVKGLVVGEDKGVPQVDPQAGTPLIGQDGSVAWQIPPGAKRKRADRIAEHMSWQLLQEQPEWDEETDKLLVIVPIVGSAFRKSYFDSNEGRNAAVLVRAENLVINYRAKSMATAPRITEELKLYPVEILEEENAGTFLHHDYGRPEGAATDDDDAPHDFLEQHRRFDLDGDGYPEPLIVTVHKQSQKVVRIVACFDPDGVRFNAATNKIQRIQVVEYYTKYDFLPNPDGGIYGVGFGQLLNPLNDSINTALNQIFDAGTLAIMGGGFIGKGLSMQSGALRFKPGEWKMVNSLGSTVRDSVVPLPFTGQSETLFKLLGFLIECGKELASNTEVLSGNQSKANVPATTTLALIEQGLKVFTSVYKRIYRSLKAEFGKQFRLNRLFLNKQSGYIRGGEWRSISQDDYTEHSGVAPVSDPSMVSDMQQLARAEFLKEFANDPLVDGAEVRRRMFEAAKIQDIDSLIKPNQPDPMAVAALRLKEIEVKSKSIQALAAAVNSLASADATVAGIQTAQLQAIGGWLTVQMEAQRAEMEALGGGDGNTGGAGAGSAGSAATPARSQPRPVRPMAAVASNPAPAAVP